MNAAHFLSSFLSQVSPFKLNRIEEIDKKPTRERESEILHPNISEHKQINYHQMISQQAIRQSEKEPKMVCEKNSKRKHCSSLLRSRTNNIKLNGNNIHILIALAFISSRQVHCNSLKVEIAAKQWHEKYSQSNSIRPTENKWIPLRDFKSPLAHQNHNYNPLETMKTSETLMQPINILSSLSRAQQNQQQQQQFMNQLAFSSAATAVAPAASQELDNSKVDLGILMASCSQLPGQEAQRQCQESYHQLQDLDSQSAHHHNKLHHLSLNIQGGFKPSKGFQVQPQQQSFAQQLAQQHLDNSASVLNIMKVPNSYHKRSSPSSSSSFVPSEAIDSVESNSGQSRNKYHNDNSGAESVDSNYVDGDENNPPLSARNGNNYHNDNRFRFNSNHANMESESSSLDEGDSDSADISSSNRFASSSPVSPAPRARRLPMMRQNQLLNQDQPPSSSSSGRQPSSTNEMSNDEDPGANERSEQEAAEASEAEAADRAALDEQQQAQQEIIKAQAASEAKAIKEQQEALMMQQRLHQQIVLRRQHDLANNQSGDKNRVGGRGDGVKERERNGNSRNGERQQLNYRESQYNNNDDDDDVVDRGEESRPDQQQQPAAVKSRKMQQMASSRRGSASVRSNLDIQFSDQPDNNAEMNSMKQLKQPQLDEQDEVGGDYSTRQASISQAPTSTEATLTPPEYKSTIVGQQVAKLIEISNQSNRSDLQPAEQHQYGSHYDSLKGHQSKYYQ